MLHIENASLEKFPVYLQGRCRCGFKTGRQNVTLSYLKNLLICYRRAKIKRLTADDRERMMRMRAVPDDFDNVQALHSSYGAVHGIGTPMQSPADFVPMFTDHLGRPLMIDTMRRHDAEDHISPTGLSPAFGHVGFASPGSMGTPDALSPLSLNSNDRYYPNHLSSPMGAGPQSSNPFDRPNNYGALSRERHQARPLQPLQLRETMSRSRSESINSPLRSSMSWKGETLDYGTYQNRQPSPQLSGRQQSVYQTDEIGSHSVNTHQEYGSIYTSSLILSDGSRPLGKIRVLILSIDTTIQSSPTHMTYRPPHGPSASLQQQTSPSTMSRMRTSSLALTPGLDIRNHYRPLSIHQNSAHGVHPTPRSSSFANAFTGGFASAPLTAPVDFSLSRTPIEGGQGARNFNIPQLSAPIAPPQDFQSAYNSSLSPVRGQNADRGFRNPAPSNMKSEGQGQTQPGDAQQQQHARPSEEVPYLRPSGFEKGQQRKRSFTSPGHFEST